MIHYLGEYERRIGFYEFYGYDDSTDEICYLLPHYFPHHLAPVLQHSSCRDKVNRIKNINYDCPAKRAYALLCVAVNKKQIIRKKSVEELENESSLI